MLFIHSKENTRVVGCGKNPTTPSRSTVDPGLDIPPLSLVSVVPWSFGFPRIVGVTRGERCG
jgi:hypothetical protein